MIGGFRVVVGDLETTLADYQCGHCIIYTPIHVAFDVSEEKTVVRDFTLGHWSIGTKYKLHLP